MMMLLLNDPISSPLRFDDDAVNDQRFGGEGRERVPDHHLINPFSLKSVGQSANQQIRWMAQVNANRAALACPH
ncbi:Uncharacterized protein TCM_030437 [Theobroma cacao]|uniref:Uncharacterized protein n=1 Tax=Theobroma cacao TaxID=3641 RepID=A0A061GHE6_THECC|nr:Uncharacterized protein TCM_030437 [Theobroma cacao]